MSDNLSRYTLRVPQIILDKIGYIANYDGRSKNKEIEFLMKNKIDEFEKEHGKIKWNYDENN
ncbi:MAG: hypothetical protein HFE59_03140 [Clostridiales bacterium]|jgi:hypothetical protein|nr:hypothetical protein [Clostridiales bacterium]